MRSEAAGEWRNRARQHLPTSSVHHHQNQPAEGAANRLDLLEHAYRVGIPEAGLSESDRDVPGGDERETCFRRADIQGNT